MSPECAVALTDSRLLKRLPGRANGLQEWLDALACSAVVPAGVSDNTPITHLHFGNEFCERLLPEVAELKRALNAAERLGVGLALATPILADAGLDALRLLLRDLPEGSEVVANDLGTLRLLQREHPALAAVAGRMLCKAIKDPRLPGEDWAKLYPAGLEAAPFIALLQRLGVGRIEIDATPFMCVEDYPRLPFALSVHAPFGYSVKGRICRPGSLYQRAGKKFAPAHECRRECLVYSGTMRREGPQGAHDLPTFQRGNALFYRHSPAMAQALVQAAGAGRVGRLVVAGDWHEHHRTD